MRSMQCVAFLVHQGFEQAYNIGGGILWVCGLTLAGYLFGNLPWVQANLSKIIWALILLPGLLALGGALRARMKSARA